MALLHWRPAKHSILASCSLLSLLLLLALVFMWIRSYWYWDPPYAQYGQFGCHFNSNSGVAMIGASLWSEESCRIYCKEGYRTEWHPVSHSRPHTPPTPANASWQFLSFAFTAGSDPMHRAISLYCPYWFATALAAFLPALWCRAKVLRRHQSRRVPRACMHCGYDLTGNVSGVCSECGKTAEWAASAPASAPSFRLVVWVAFLVLCAYFQAAMMLFDHEREWDLYRHTQQVERQRASQIELLRDNGFRNGRTEKRGDFVFLYDEEGSFIHIYSELPPPALTRWRLVQGVRLRVWTASDLVYLLFLVLLLYAPCRRLVGDLLLATSLVLNLAVPGPYTRPLTLVSALGFGLALLLWVMVHRKRQNASVRPANDVGAVHEQRGESDGRSAWAKGDKTWPSSC